MAYPNPVLLEVARGHRVRAGSITHDVIESAQEHRMVGLLLSAIENPDELEFGVEAELTALDLAIQIRQATLGEVLAKVHHLLSGTKTPHTFIKGATATARWFEKMTHRPFLDIDVVVPDRHMNAAVEILDSQHPALKAGVLGGPRGVSTVSVVLDDVYIDVQTDALRSGLPPADSTAWTVGTATVIVNELAIPALDIEHDLVMFLLHQGRDRFRYLLGIAEARRRLNDEIDWEGVVTIARGEGIWDQVGIALKVVCDELRLDPPVSPPEGWRADLWRFLWRPKVRLLGELGRFKHIRRADWLMPLTMRGRFREAAAAIWRSVFPSSSVLRTRHPDATGPYLWRLVSSRFKIIGRRRIWAWSEPSSRDSDHPTGN